MGTFDVSIITPEKIVYKQSVRSVIVPAQAGYWGVLSSHAPMIANLIPGNISIVDNEGKDITFQTKDNGFVEVIQNQVTILLDKFE
jgi:F-type H+-transporting ATPase subunit epsilon